MSGGAWGSSWGESWSVSWGTSTVGCSWGNSWGDSWGESWCPGESQASGALFVVSATFIPGVASGEQADVGVSPPRPFIIPRHGRALGAIFEVRARIISGRARGTAQTAGDELAALILWEPGIAGVSVEAAGIELELRTVFTAGVAKGENGWIKYDNDFILGIAA